VDAIEDFLGGLGFQTLPMKVSRKEKQKENEMGEGKMKSG